MNEAKDEQNHKRDEKILRRLRLSEVIRERRR